MATRHPAGRADCTAHIRWWAGLNRVLGDRREGGVRGGIMTTVLMATPAVRVEGKACWGLLAGISLAGMLVCVVWMGPCPGVACTICGIKGDGSVFIEDGIAWVM